MIEQIPASVATAISAVMSGIKTLGKDDKNKHQGYDFVSTDKFLSAVNPLCAAAGLIIVQDEADVHVADKFLTAKYEFILAHKDGSTWGPVKRTVVVGANGAQAFGSAQSYALKQFMRSLFQISTGDKDDADLQPDTELPDNRKPANQQKPTLDTDKQDASLKQSQERTAENLIERITKVNTTAALNELWKASAELIKALPDHLKSDVRGAASARKELLTGGEEAA
jgi:hypothetical protein